MGDLQFAITGNPVSHSLSPALFRAAYPQLSATYNLLPATSAKEAFAAFNSLSLKGMNITSPFKGDILPFADILSPECLATGAANLLLHSPNGVTAYNTDVDGVIGSFEAFTPILPGTGVLVLGAGGAGRAAAFALLKKGCKVFLVNRHPEKAEVFTKAEGGVPANPESANNILETCSLVVNTLPPGAEVLQNLALSRQHFVLDASYSQKPLLKTATIAGAHYIDGIYWLYYQAIPSFLLFTEIPPLKNAMLSLLGL